MKRIALLTEDDASPDAIDSFIKNLKDQFNLDFDDFKKKGVNKSGTDSIILEYKGYTLENYADYPFWQLYKKVNVWLKTGWVKNNKNARLLITGLQYENNKIISYCVHDDWFSEDRMELFFEVCESPLEPSQS